MTIARHVFRFLQWFGDVVFALAAACWCVALIMLVLVAYATHLTEAGRAILSIMFYGVMARCCAVVVLAFAFRVFVSAIEAAFVKTKGN